MRVSIIIPTAGNRIGYLIDVLETAQSQDFPKSDFEIIVVDNSERKAVTKILEKEGLNKDDFFICIREDKPGLHNARHAGARKARGEILVFIDDDIILPRKWLSAILEPFKDPKVGCSGGKVLPRWESTPPLWFDQFDKGYLSLLDYGETTHEIKDAGIWGCNMAVRKCSFFQVGGSNVDFYSEQKLIWYSGDGECGLEEKLLRAGYTIIYEPRAFVYHRIPASRLTPQYFYQRFFFTGIHKSYSRARALKENKAFFLCLLIFAFSDLLKSVIKYIESNYNYSAKIKTKADSYRFFSQALHSLLTIFSSKFRAHVLQDSYI